MHYSSLNVINFEGTHYDSKLTQGSSILFASITNQSIYQKETAIQLLHILKKSKQYISFPKIRMAVMLTEMIRYPYCSKHRRSIKSGFLLPHIINWYHYCQLYQPDGK